MAILVGRVTITVNGVPVRLRTGAKAGGIGGLERNTVLGETPHGFVEKAVAAYCEFSITADDEVSVKALHQLTNTTIVFESYEGAQIGKTLILRNAYSVTPPEISAGEGETPMRFESSGDWEEL